MFNLKTLHKKDRNAKKKGCINLQEKLGFENNIPELTCFYKHFFKKLYTYVFLKCREFPQKILEICFYCKILFWVFLILEK